MKMDEIFAHPIAHRGLHDRKKGVIENSKTAFQRAIKAGYAIECDLQLSGDDIPVVFHDPELDRLTKQTGPLAKLSAGQLTRIRLTASKKADTPQTLTQLLEQVDSQVPLIVELKNQQDNKNEALSKAAVEAVREYKGPIVFKSFYPSILAYVRAAGFSGPTGIIITEITPENDHYHELSAFERLMVHSLLHYPKSKFNFISANYDALDLPAVRFFRKIGFPVMTWTIKSFEIEQKTRGHADQLVFENYLPYRAS